VPPVQWNKHQTGTIPDTLYKILPHTHEDRQKLQRKKNEKNTKKSKTWAISLWTINCVYYLASKIKINTSIDIKKNIIG